MFGPLPAIMTFTLERMNGCMADVHKNGRDVEMSMMAKFVEEDEALSVGLSRHYHRSLNFINVNGIQSTEFKQLIHENMATAFCKVTHIEQPSKEVVYQYTRAIIEENAKTLHEQAQRFIQVPWTPLGKSFHNLLNVNVVGTIDGLKQDLTGIS
jgi:hypothetical protein